MATTQSLQAVHSFGASVVINYEFNEFVREQKDKSHYRQMMAFAVVFIPACVLVIFGIVHLAMGANALWYATRLSVVVNRNIEIAWATIKLNDECGATAYAILQNARNGTLNRSEFEDYVKETNIALNSSLIWTNPMFSWDRTYAAFSGDRDYTRSFNYTTFAEFYHDLEDHRASIFNSTFPSPTTNALEELNWCRPVTNDFYSQVSEIVNNNTQLAIWPNLLDTDYAYMFHRLLYKRRILGATFLYEGGSYRNRSTWHDLVASISDEELLLGSAQFMAPSFRRFIRSVQLNTDPYSKGQKINWKNVNHAQEMLMDIEIRAAEGLRPLKGNVTFADYYYQQLSQIMNQTELYVKRQDDRITNALADAETFAYSRCAWSAILIILTIGGGILNLYAIREFISHFVMEVETSATEHMDKTLDLRTERRKTNMVLHTMLPKKVADELKFRKFVRPMYYESVSMYFSDVQGFTALSSRSTPEQIVCLLTKLYTAFDDILNDYKVWKLETIGDAYCIIAGTTNQDDFDSPADHAKEIINCSLAIRDHIRSYPIPHFPEENVKIRIGVHTGSVVAGVAGVGMHRYCVVGDALSVVERVEAAGKHGRVHISEDTRKALFKQSSTETVNDTTSGNTETTDMGSPNYFLYICVPNSVHDVVLFDNVINTYWIDRRKPLEAGLGLSPSLLEEQGPVTKAEAQTPEEVLPKKPSKYMGHLFSVDVGE